MITIPRPQPPRPPPDPDGIPDCLQRNPFVCLDLEASQFEGQGSEIEARLRDPSWYATLGMAFDFPIGEALLLHAKPSIAYAADQVELSGRITTVTEISIDDPFFDNAFEVHRGSASTSTTDHSLGFGLELGLSLFRQFRPIRTTLYAEARFLWLLSDPTTTFSDPIATYEVSRKSFGIRGGAGVRFAWMGFSPR